MTVLNRYFVHAVVVLVAIALSGYSTIDRLIPTTANLGQVTVQAPGNVSARATPPGFENSRLHCMLLEGKNYMSGSGIEQVDIRSQADRKTHFAWSIHLGHDYHVAVAEHGKMAGLAGYLGDVLHERPRGANQTL